MPFESEQLEKIKKDLPKGYAKKLGEKFNIYPRSVNRILNGQSSNDEVVLAAFELAQEYQQKLEHVKQALAS